MAATLLHGLSLMAIGLSLLDSGSAQGQEVELSRPQARFLKEVASDVGKMENYLAKDRWPQALKFHDAAVEKLAAVKDELIPPELMEALQPELERLAAGRTKLEAEGLVPAEAPALRTGSGTVPDFARDIAPILDTRCGNCHVRNARGQFSMASYMALMDSGQVEAGQPVNSRLVQVLENGEMPPDAANRVPEEEVARIREWIAAGAAFEGDANAGLGMIAGGEVEGGGGAAMTEIARPTGKETVSFSRQVAPLLVQHCRGCHVEAERPRGNLDLSTITALLRGGDRGGTVTAGDGAGSLLVKKLRGTADGQRMPQAAPPLAEDQIALIEKWIAEGAAFDGSDPALPLGTLAALAAAQSMDDAALADNRRELAEKNWQLAFPGEQPTMVENADFRLVSSLPEPVRNQRLAQLQTGATALRDVLELDPQQALVRGKVTVFLFARQYDFAEFSRMVLQRGVSDGSPATWLFNGVDAWVAVHASDQMSEEQLEGVLTANLAAVHVAGLAAGTPRWFANGTGLYATQLALPDNSSVRDLAEKGAMAARQLSGPGAIRSPDTAEPVAALASCYFFKSLLGSGDRLRRALQTLSAAGEFEPGFRSAFGASPVELLPDQANGGRPGRNRE